MSTIFHKLIRIIWNNVVIESLISVQKNSLICGQKRMLGKITKQSANPVNNSINMYKPKGTDYMHETDTNCKRKWRYKTDI